MFSFNHFSNSKLPPGAFVVMTTVAIPLYIKPCLELLTMKSFISTLISSCLLIAGSAMAADFKYHSFVYKLAGPDTQGVLAVDSLFNSMNLGVISPIPGMPSQHRAVALYNSHPTNFLNANVLSNYNSVGTYWAARTTAASSCANYATGQKSAMSSASPTSVSIAPGDVCYIGLEVRATPTSVIAYNGTFANPDHWPSGSLSGTIDLSPTTSSADSIASFPVSMSFSPAGAPGNDVSTSALFEDSLFIQSIAEYLPGTTLTDGGVKSYGDGTFGVPYYFPTRSWYPVIATQTLPNHGISVSIYEDLMSMNLIVGADVPNRSSVIAITVNGSRRDLFISD